MYRFAAALFRSFLKRARRVRCAREPENTEDSRRTGRAARSAGLSSASCPSDRFASAVLPALRSGTAEPVSLPLCRMNLAPSRCRERMPFRGGLFRLSAFPRSPLRLSRRTPDLGTVRADRNVPEHPETSLDTVPFPGRSELPAVRNRVSARGNLVAN